jgi:hypothetical protein
MVYAAKHIAVTSYTCLDVAQSLIAKLEAHTHTHTHTHTYKVSHPSTPKNL